MSFLRGKLAESYEGIYWPDPLFESASNVVFSCFCGSSGICPAFSQVREEKNLMANSANL